MRRIEELRERGVTAEEIGAVDVTKLVEVVRHGATLEIVRRLHASDLDRADVVRWLRSLPIDPAVRVTAIWPADARGVALHYRDLADQFDVLWYPSSDDVWVTGPDSGAWLLELDHEEVFTLWSRR